MGPTETSILVHLLVQRDHSRRKIPRNVYSPSIDRRKLLIPIFPPVRVSKKTKTRKRSSMRGLAPPAMRARTVPPTSQRRPVHWRHAEQSVGRVRARAWAGRGHLRLPSATRSFTCCVVVIIPMVMSGCAFLIASANGTCEESENGCYHVIMSPICISPYLVPRPDRNPLNCPVSPGADIDQIDPELFQLAG